MHTAHRGRTVQRVRSTNGCMVQEGILERHQDKCLSNISKADDLQHLSDAEIGALTRALFSKPSHDPKPRPSTEKAREFALRCTEDIEVVAEALACLGDQLNDERGKVVASLMRCHAARIKQLNAGVMKHLQGKASSDDMQDALYGGLPARKST